MYSNVAASTISEGRQGVKTTASTAGSHSKAPRQTNREKDMALQRSAVRPSRDVAKDSTVLAGE